MKMKQKTFGFEGSISPASVVKDLTEKWEQNGINFSLNQGIFRAEFSTKNQEKNALEAAHLYVQIWSLRHDARLKVKFHHFWGPKANRGTQHSASLNENVKVSDRAQTVMHRVSSEVRASITGKSDSASIMANKLLVEKSLKDESLKRAIEFYSEEVVDEKRPLYGIYKALEVLIDSLRGSSNKKTGVSRLGELAGKNPGYVQEVLERTQLQRHANSPARNILTEQECRTRAKNLIRVYTDAID